MCMLSNINSLRSVCSACYFVVLAGNSTLLQYLRSLTLVTRSYALLLHTKTSHHQDLNQSLYSALYVEMYACNCICHKI